MGVISNNCYNIIKHKYMLILMCMDPLDMLIIYNRWKGTFVTPIKCVYCFLCVPPFSGQEAELVTSLRSVELCSSLSASFLILEPFDLVSRNFV
jgi:hypothetical protein